MTPGLNNSTSEEISTLKKKPSSHLKERSQINDCNTSLEELNIKSPDPLEKASNIILNALTNNEKVDEIPEIESITQPSKQEETNTETILGTIGSQWPLSTFLPLYFRHPFSDNTHF